MMMKQALIFAGGDAGEGSMVTRIFEQAHNALVIAADGGARLAAHYGYQVDTVIGDMDSLSLEEVETLEQNGTLVQRYPAEKDETDLELVLKWAVAQGIDWLRVIGGMGGRFDQVIANVYLLALPELRGINAALVAGNQIIYLLHPGQHSIKGASGDTVSLIPLGGVASGISTEHLQYPLTDETLFFGPARGISNVMMSDTATVTLENGLLLLVHTEGRA